MTIVNGEIIQSNRPLRPSVSVVVTVLMKDTQPSGIRGRSPSG
jgi:hypothetical protein